MEIAAPGLFEWIHDLILLIADKEQNGLHAIRTFITSLLLITDLLEI